MPAQWAPGCRRAAVALFWMSMAPVWVQAQSLASIPVEPPAQRDVSVETGESSGLRARVHVFDVQGLASLLGRSDAVTGAARSLEVTLMPGAHPDVRTSADTLAASFIVDFDDPAVVQLSRRLVEEQAPAAVGGEQILAFVAKSMHSHYAANANLASEVARSLQGDCTEHALLTAALARSIRIPARIVQGAALVYADGQWQAYGHAWAQTFEAGRWHVRDSALANWAGPVYYLPAFVFADEGPGYKLDMMRGFGRMPSRIEILGPASKAAAQ